MIQFEKDGAIQTKVRHRTPMVCSSSDSTCKIQELVYVVYYVYKDHESIGVNGKCYQPTKMLFTHNIQSLSLLCCILSSRSYLIGQEYKICKLKLSSLIVYFPLNGKMYKIQTFNTSKILTWTSLRYCAFNCHCWNVLLCYSSGSLEITRKFINFRLLFQKSNESHLV